MDVLLGLALSFLSIFLILVILVQRGRGGGLSGAISGASSNSAFGAKTGDAFTKITVVVAATWILLCALSVLLLSKKAAGPLNKNLGGAANTSPEGNLSNIPKPGDGEDKGTGSSTPANDDESNTNSENSTGSENNAGGETDNSGSNSAPESEQSSGTEEDDS